MTESKSTEVKIQFASKHAAEHFMEWLCGSGEQEYWNWMEYREDEEDGDITAIELDYDFKKHTITTTLGRIVPKDE
jgi:hypothetical protein